MPKQHKQNLNDIISKMTSTELNGSEVGEKPPFNMELLIPGEDEKLLSYMKEVLETEKSISQQARQITERMLWHMRGITTKNKRRDFFKDVYFPFLANYHVDKWARLANKSNIVQDNLSLDELYNLVVVPTLNTAVAGIYGDVYETAGRITHYLGYDLLSGDFVIEICIVPGNDVKFAPVCLMEIAIPRIRLTAYNGSLEGIKFEAKRISKKLYEANFKR